MVPSGLQPTPNLLQFFSGAEFDAQLLELWRGYHTQQLHVVDFVFCHTTQKTNHIFFLACASFWYKAKIQVLTFYAFLCI